MEDSPPLELFVVSHTHWDREWYHPEGRFRQRLVSLIDELLDTPERGAPFLLDGQTVVLQDYLALRPERAAELSERLRGGAIEAGPWYVLADELLPGGEALVRNLLTGRRTLAALRAEAPRVLYCPDAFGHPAALPMLASGFGMGVVVLWRGFGGAAWPSGDVARWSAPDGSSVVLYHLPPDGYEFGSSLPADDAGARARWSRMREVLLGRARLGMALLPNGADHHAPQRALDDALEALRRAISGDAMRRATPPSPLPAFVTTADGRRVSTPPGGMAALVLAGPDAVLRRSGIAAFAEELERRAARAALPDVAGELRDSRGHAWSLQGTFGTRAAQKRRNARVERLLVRRAEPWAALAFRRGASPRRAFLHAAWRTLLQTHPHDTLCGCSVDAVARAADQRWDDAAAQARGVLEDSVLDVVGHDAEEARRRRDEWRPVLLLRNDVARPRGGLAEITLRRTIGPVPVGPASAGVGDPGAPRLPPATLEGGSVPLQRLHARPAFDRVESPRDYPANDLVLVERAVAWVPAVPAYGTLGLAVDASTGRDSPAVSPPAPVRAAPRTLENDRLRVSIEPDDTVTLVDLASGTTLRDVLRVEHQGDDGDLYTAAPRGPVTRARLDAVELRHAGPLRGTLVLRLSLVVPSRRRARESARAAAAPPPRPRPVTLRVRLRLTLDAGAEVLSLAVRGRNRARDHRLRLVIATGLAGPAVRADAAFGPVARRVAPAPEPADAAELLPPTAPLHRYVTLGGESRSLTLISDGLGEYEATASGDLAVTLVRAVGELSRADLPERRGHVGWPTPVPGAQSPGPFRARFALLPHGPASNASAALVERTADAVLLPLVGRTLRSALCVPEPTLGPELRGEGLAFSCYKKSEQHDWLVARCVNVTDAVVEGRWYFGTPISSAYLARLDETLLAQLPAEDREVTFTARPHETVTILVR